MIKQKIRHTAAWSFMLAALILNPEGFGRDQGSSPSVALGGSVIESTFNEAVTMHLHQMRLREGADQASRASQLETMDVTGRRAQRSESARAELRLFSEGHSMALEQGLRRMQEGMRTWADAELERSRSRHETLHSEHRQRLAERIAKGEEIGKKMVAALTGVPVETETITEGSDREANEAIDATLDTGTAVDKVGASSALKVSNNATESPMKFPPPKVPYTETPSQPVLPMDFPLVRTATSELHTDAPRIEAKAKRDQDIPLGIASEELQSKRLSPKEEAVRDTALKAATEIAYGRLMGKAAGQIVGRLFAVMDLLEPVELGRPEDALLRYKTEQYLEELDREEERLRVLLERYQSPVQGIPVE